MGHHNALIIPSQCNIKEEIIMSSSKKKSTAKKPANGQRQFVNASGQAVNKPTGSGKKTTSSTAAKKPAAKAASTAAKKPASQKAVSQKPSTKPNGKTAYVSAENKKKANGLRIGAVVLWLVAIAFEVLTILVLNGTLYIPGNTMTYVIIGIVADLACVIIGSQLWKKANRLDPCSEKNKLKFFLWNQMGVIAAVVAFFPLVLLLLKEDDLDPQTKKILSIIAAVAMLLSVGTSIDYNPVSAEDLAQAQSDAYEYSIDGETCYWTSFGRCYHFNPDCHTIINSNPVYTGTVAEAFEANRSKPCSYCATAEGEELFADRESLLTSDSDLADLEEYISGTDLIEEIVSYADAA